MGDVDLQLGGYQLPSLSSGYWRMQQALDDNSVLATATGNNVSVEACQQMVRWLRMRLGTDSEKVEIDSDCTPINCSKKVGTVFFEHWVKENEMIRNLSNLTLCCVNVLNRKVMQIIETLHWTWRTDPWNTPTTQRGAPLGFHIQLQNTGFRGLHRFVAETNWSLCVGDLFCISWLLCGVVLGPPPSTRSCMVLTSADGSYLRGHIKYKQNATVCPRSIAKAHVCLNVNSIGILSGPHRFHPEWCFTFVQITSKMWLALRCLNLN